MSLQSTLRSMSRNSANRCRWTKLDADICQKAAEQIDQLTAQRDQLLAALEGIKELMGYEWLRPEFEQADAAIKAAKGE